MSSGAFLLMAGGFFRNGYGGNNGPWTAARLRKAYKKATDVPPPVRYLCIKCRKQRENKDDKICLACKGEPNG